ncbi:AurF N-oxygenase family protein [Nocardioides ultimimeridianus]
MTETTERVGTDYAEALRTLSEASVEVHFDAFADIAWDDPQLAIVADDPRWILPDADPLARTDWYRSLPQERQIEVGLERFASMLKVGLQFEQVLIGGIMTHAMVLPNGSPEFRYSTHEAAEECHHTQMFQEFVNRTGSATRGAPRWFRRLAPFLPLAGGVLPSVFFIGVLAGEEPIDHFQKGILRSGHRMHPLLQRIVQIHIAEEARHIGFAHHYLRRRAGEAGRFQRFWLSLALPLIMRVLGDVIMKPSRAQRRALGIPRSAVRQAFWRDPVSRKDLRDTFSDVRMLAEEMGLMTPAGRWMWRRCGIDGRPARFRSEPVRASS